MSNVVQGPQLKIERFQLLCIVLPSCSLDGNAPIGSVDASPLLWCDSFENYLSTLHLRGAFLTGMQYRHFIGRCEEFTHETPAADLLACNFPNAGYSSSLSLAYCCCAWVDPTKQNG